MFTNVDYRSPSALHEPAFDWLTFDQIQASMDKILQESIACYDPASQITVFVFLLSESKRSMAIWRRKLPLPENIRHTYGTHLPKLVGGLDKKYPILLDELSRSNYQTSWSAHWSLAECLPLPQQATLIAASLPRRSGSTGVDDTHLWPFF